MYLTTSYQHNLGISFRDELSKLGLVSIKISGEC